LWAFLSQRAAESPEAEAKLDSETVLGLMKYDYFLNHKYKPRTTWWDFTMDKQELNGWMRKLAESPAEVSGGFHKLGISERELHKHAVIERLPFDLQAYLENGTVSKAADTLLVMVYQPEAGKSVQSYSLRLEKSAT
jgi:anaerobic magnesium-protoporphyrin IX monomethyl ester cyclase